MKLRNGSAELPGQLKISEIFSAKCEKNTNDDSNKKDHRPCIVDTDVQEKSISSNVFNPSCEVLIENSLNEVCHLPTLNTNGNRDYEEIRFDIVSNAMDLISKRMNIEDERSMKLIKNMTTANSCSELVERSTDALKTFFMDDDRFDDETDRLNRERINSLTNDICEQWPVIKDVPTLDTSDIGCKYATRLRQMFVKSKGEFKFLLGALLVSVPHNMGTERVVSHFNKVESLHRRSQDIETVAQRLVVSINSNGTAHFDPRPATGSCTIFGQERPSFSSSGFRSL